MADEARGDGTGMRASSPPTTGGDDPLRTGQDATGEETAGEEAASGEAASGEAAGGEAGDAGRPPSTSRWAPAGRLARFLLGAFSLVAGLTWIMLNLHGPSAGLDLLVGFVLMAGGLVLLMPHRISLPRRATAVSMTVAGLAGTAVGLLSARTKECCEFAYIVDRGWPVTWAQRGGLADSPDAARRLAGSANWTVDLVALGTDVLLWAYAGLLLVVIAVLVRRARSDHDGPRR